MLPFVIPPQVGAAVVSGIGSVLNGILGSDAQREANEMNYKIAQETNQLSYKMMQEQNAFNRQQAIDMFNMENEYNSPSAVKQRLQDAGINPFVALSGNGTAFANGDASTPTGASVPSLVAPTMNPVPSPLNGVLPEIANTIKTMAEAKKLGIENDNLKDMINQQMLSLKLDNKRKDWDLYLDKLFNLEERQSNLTGQDLENDLKGQDLNKKREEINNLVEDVLNKQRQGKILDTQFEAEQLRRDILKVDKDFAQRIHEQELKNLIEQGNQIVASTHLANEQISFTRRQKNLLGKTFQGVELSSGELKEVKDMIKASATSDKVAAEANAAIEEMNKAQNKNAWFKAMHKAKRFVREIPVLGNLLEIFGSESGKATAKQLFK